MIRGCQSHSSLSNICRNISLIHLSFACSQLTPILPQLRDINSEIREIHAKKMKQEDLTSKIIACTYKVHNTLGFGFLETIYQNALLIELTKAGLHAEKEKKN